MADDQLAARVRYRKRLVYGFGIVGAGAILFIIKDLIASVVYYWSRNRVITEVLASLLPIFVGAFGAYILLTAYLRYDRGSRQVKIDSVNREPSETSNPPKNEENSTEDEDPEDETEFPNRTDQSGWQPLPQEQRIQLLFDATQNRLRREIRALERRSTINLSVGVIIAAVGVGTLFYLVLKQQPPDHTVPGILTHYLPRISTVALIEAFSYFFLNLYRSDLEEIKYYLNERITSTDLNIAWIAAGGEEKTKTASLVIEQLSKRDRNKLTAKTEKDGAPKIDVADLLKLCRRSFRTKKSRARRRNSNYSLPDPAQDLARRCGTGDAGQTK